MKNIREKLNLNDRTKLLLSVTAVGLLLIAAMLVPLAFRTSVKDPSALQPINAEAAKAELFAAYWNKGPEEADIQVEKPEELSPEMTAQCEARFRELISQCIIDLALELPEPTGREYTALHGSDGTEVQLCRMWLEAKGDWQNWLDVCFDSETGRIYYFYLSRECLRNQRLYESRSSGTKEIAELLASAYGWTLRYLGGDGENSGATAVFSSGGATLCYQIDCKFYDALIDVRLCCK